MRPIRGGKTASIAYSIPTSPENEAVRPCIREKGVKEGEERS